MATKYTVRVASPVAYEYWEAEADTFQELLAAEQELRELKAEAGGDVTPAQGEANVKKAFGKTTEQPAKSGGFGGKGGGGQQSLPDKIDLGEHDGYKITLYTKGKFGAYLNAYQKGADPERWNANLEKGADPSKVSLEEAVEILSAAYPGGK